ncbi:NAD-dependent deacetylase hst4 [Verticillium dahliae VDG2]|nr:NAD-dependent deacetylase hst4 [Verticillium dahliae VDG2]
MTGATLRDGQADLPSERSTASYWHREPSEKLLGHRTTAELPATADVVIIGSGITGAFAAHFLKEANAASDVLMLEAREACWGATGRNGGHCQPSVYGLSTAVARFELNTYAFLRDLVAEHDVPCDWVSFPGVHAFYTPDLFAAAALRIADLGRAHPDLAAKARVVAARKVLLACNGHTSRLVPAFSDLLVPVRGQVAALMPGPGQRALEHSYVFMGVPRKGPSQDDYLVQRPKGREELILGGGRSRGTARGVGASADDWLDPVVASYLRQTLGATTGIAEGELAATYEWTGIMGYSRDFLPWVGEVPKALGGDTGLWVAAGYTGHGMPRAALCAKAVVGMMNGQELEVAEAVGLPHEFLVSEERAARAREMDNVTVADLKDMFV